MKWKIGRKKLLSSENFPYGKCIEWKDNDHKAICEIRFIARNCITDDSIIKYKYIRTQNMVYCNINFTNHDRNERKFR